MKNYEEKICEAINTIVSHAISEAGYDRTVQATVLSCVSPSVGKYRVKYQDSVFHAYTTDPTVSYSSGSRVYVLIPGNDMTKEKTILSASPGSSSTSSFVISTTEKDNRYNYIGSNTISPIDEETKSILISSYAPYTNGKELYLKEIYNKNSDSNLIAINEIALKDYLGESSHLICGANFKTSFDDSQKTKGNYGIVFTLSFKDDLGKDIVRTYIVDVDNMIGDPYNLVAGKKQFGIFEVDGKNFVSVDSVYVFTMDFPVRDSVLAAQKLDIEISEIELWGAEQLSEEEMNSCSINIKTPQGAYFLNDNDVTDTLDLVAEVKVKGKQVNTKVQKIDFYWFIEDVTINTDSATYNRYGGRGWSCLNETKPQEEGMPTVWIPHGDTYTVREAMVFAKETRFKCVAIYSDVAYSKTVSVKHLGGKYEITVGSNLGTNFFYNVGSPTLTCYVNGEEASQNFSYKWIRIDSYGNIVALPAVLDGLLIVDSVDRNKLIGVNVADISNIATYKCGVYLEGNCIGIGSITLTNKSDSDNADRYTVVLNNGTQIFKYDEYGVSPFAASKDTEDVIKTLSFTVYDGRGEELTQDMLRNWDIIWRVPNPYRKDSLLIFDFTEREFEIIKEHDDYAYMFGRFDLDFKIENRFSYDKGNNDIELFLTLGDINLTAKTNLVAIKEGDPGTNGSDFVCKIRPRLLEGEILAAAPMITVTEGNRVGRFNFGGVSITDATITTEPFKCSLYENGEEIPQSSELSYTWSILKNTYRTNMYDRSFYQVTDSTRGLFTLDGGLSYRLDGSMDNMSFANILQCKIRYDGKDYYDTMPLTTAIVKEGYSIELVKYTGFNHVMYGKDGTNPKYDANKPFTVVLKQDGRIVSGAEFDWTPYGSRYDYDLRELYEDPMLTEKSVNLGEGDFKPKSAFDGVSVTNGIRVVALVNGEIKAAIYIPVHLYLNRYGFAELNGWNGNTVEIDSEGGYVIAPEVGAGVKNDDNNTFTGILMGKIHDPNESIQKVGLIGLVEGVKSFFLDAKTGKASFGTPSAGQLEISPKESQLLIKSGDYKKNDTDGKGLEINFSTPSITYGNGNFAVDGNGRLTAKGVSIDGGSISIVKADRTKSFSVSNDGVVTINGGSITIRGSEGKSFEVTNEGVLTANSVNVTGDIKGNGQLKIGNYFIVNNNSMSIGSSSYGLTFDSNGQMTFGENVSLKWGQLNNIPNDLAYQDDIPTIPSYIKSTYIDQTKIMSPSIYGGVVSVRASGEYGGTGCQLYDREVQFYYGSQQTGKICTFDSTIAGGSDSGLLIRSMHDGNTRRKMIISAAGNIRICAGEGAGGGAWSGKLYFYDEENTVGRSLSELYNGVAVFS